MIKTQKENGGPAFPRALPPDCTFDREGMSLRDWFAGQALTGIIARLGTDVDQKTVVSTAYQFADVMLKKR